MGLEGSKLPLKMSIQEAASTIPKPATAGKWVSQPSGGRASLSCALGDLTATLVTN